MRNASALSSSHLLAADAQSLNRLKLAADQRSPQAIRETARQLESLFMRELIKSMRQATPSAGMLDNSGTKLGQDLLDQQLSVQMSGQRGGMSDIIASQMARQMGVALDADARGTTPPSNLQAGTLPARPLAPQLARQSVAAYQNLSNARPATAAQTSFVQNQTAVASRVERETGIPASYMIGQAGLETGWGQHQIRVRGGQPSYNLFGIKAGGDWSGKVAEVTTTEYVNGVAQKRVARFRAYNSYEDAYRDYARLLQNSPRYSAVARQTGSADHFARGLQKAGYATDPQYAVKVARAIETTQRLQARMQAMAQSSS